MEEIEERDHKYVLKYGKIVIVRRILFLQT